MKIGQKKTLKKKVASICVMHVEWQFQICIYYFLIHSSEITEIECDLELPKGIDT